MTLMMMMMTLVDNDNGSQYRKCTMHASLSHVYMDMTRFDFLFAWELFVAIVCYLHQVVTQIFSCKVFQEPTFRSAWSCANTYRITIYAWMWSLNGTVTVYMQVKVPQSILPYAWLLVSLS